MCIAMRRSATDRQSDLQKQGKVRLVWSLKGVEKTK
jgi:hypothetical protein